MAIKALLARFWAYLLAGRDTLDRCPICTSIDCDAVSLGSTVTDWRCRSCGAAWRTTV